MVDEVINRVRAPLRGHSVIDRIDDVISPEAVTNREPLRAVDVLIVVNILSEALRHA